MKIGILGTGRVGQALGKRWIGKGHDVVFGTRQDLKARRDELSSLMGVAVETVPHEHCLTECEVVVLASPWPAAKDWAAQIPKASRPVLIDCLNPLLPDLSALSVPPGVSTAEILLQVAPHVAIVKAFNCASSATLANPAYADSTPTMLFCGDDEAAKKMVGTLIEDIGFEAVDVGDLKMAQHLESLALLTIKMAIKNQWGGDCALKVLTRSPQAD